MYQALQTAYVGILSMARYKGNAHDVYEKNADFIHESTLTKTVGDPSEHFHKSNLSWTSDTNITIKSPEVEETYNTVIHRKNVSIYAYLLFKGLITQYNQSLYGYSKNKSIMYLNVSGVTTNTGVFFILPGPYLYYAGALQIKISAITMDVGSVAKEMSPPSTARKFEVDANGVATVVRTTPGLTFVVDPKGQTTIDQSTSKSNMKINTSKRYIRAKKAKYYGGIYVKRTTTQHLS